MSTRSKRTRCTVCRTPLPETTKTGKCPACVGQTVLFPKRLAERLSRRSGGGR